MQPFGHHLRRWRHARGLSQLALAGSVETSPRHVSFLESGRSVPGRDMVLRLATALEVTPGELDAALAAAGHARARAPGPSGLADRSALRHAAASLLREHDPLPGLVLDEDWFVVDANVGASRLLGLLADVSGSVGSDPGRPRDAPPDLIDVLVAHARPGGALIDGLGVATLALARLRLEHAATEPGSASDARLTACVERLEEALAAHGATTAVASSVADDTDTTLALRVRVGPVRLALRSVLMEFAGLDRPDVRAPRVELLYAEDAATAAWFGAPDTFPD